MIICFEGLIAVGKTTMCEKLSFEFAIIPDVNVLFKETNQKGKFWYYEKQIDKNNDPNYKHQLIVNDKTVRWQGAYHLITY